MTTEGMGVAMGRMTGAQRARAAMHWPGSERDGSWIPPMGQGLAVVASIACIALTLMAVLGVYLLSLHVQAVHGASAAMGARLRAAQQDVQRLQTEIDIRSRYAELERWSPVLGLHAAEEWQYAVNVRELGAVASARRAQIAGAPPMILIAQNDCAASPACRAAPAGGRRGYTPQARHQMDSLIGDLAR